MQLIRILWLGMIYHIRFQLVKLKEKALTTDLIKWIPLNINLCPWFFHTKLHSIEKIKKNSSFDEYFIVWSKCITRLQARYITSNNHMNGKFKFLFLGTLHNICDWFSHQKQISVWFNTQIFKMRFEIISIRGETQKKKTNQQQNQFFFSSSRR